MIEAPDQAPPDPELSSDIAAHVLRLQGYCNTLAAIGTPDAIAAIEAMTAALETLSIALNLAGTAMIAATPTSH